MVTATNYRGYARHQQDEDRLVAAGVELRYIYRADKGQGLLDFTMRPGEWLFVVDGLRAFGTSPTAMVRAVKHIHSVGAAICDAETRLRSDRDGAEMHALATGKLDSDRARRNQRKAARSRIHDGRMPIEQAEALWFNLRLSREQITERTGWPWRTLYTRLGPREHQDNTEE